MTVRWQWYRGVGGRRPVEYTKLAATACDLRRHRPAFPGPPDTREEEERWVEVERGWARLHRTFLEEGR